MTWQLYAVTALILIVLATVGAVVWMLGLDGQMAVGLGAGFGLSIPLMVFSHFNMKRAMRSKSQTATLGHIYGGFGLRLVILLIGFFALAFTGFGSPAGFAVAFMAGVLMSLGWQMMTFVNETVRRRVQAVQATAN
ncbi:MAG: hypothetical protein KDB90_17235 [Planctomycetes bacterium]|nr:hypothetical protein [Planctomycetota bacterium]